MNWVFLQRWHKRVGLTAALIVVMLVVTGILLNHTTELELEKRYVKSGWILDWYRIAPDKPASSFKAGENIITLMGDRLYLNTSEIQSSVQQLHGAVKINELFIAGIDSRLILIDATGQLIEQLDGVDGVPSGMRQLGIDQEQQLIIRAAHGDYRLDLDEITWEEEDEIEADWSEPFSISVSLERQLLEQYRGKGLPVERVMLDLHSGRILGEWGVWIIDLAALMMLILAMSGFLMWFQRR